MVIVPRRLHTHEACFGDRFHKLWNYFLEVSLSCVPIWVVKGSCNSTRLMPAFDAKGAECQNSPLVHTLCYSDRLLGTAEALRLQDHRLKLSGADLHHRGSSWKGEG